MNAAMTKNRLAFFSVLAGLSLLLGYVALRSGPLAAVRVSESAVEIRTLNPELFGIATVEAQFSYRIGPTQTGRLQSLTVQVGDQVSAGQLLGRMDPLDLEERVKAQEAAMKKAEALLVEAQARQEFAASQQERYQRLFAAQTVSEELLAAKGQERQIAEAALQAAREEERRSQAEFQVLLAQRANLQLLAPVSGMITARESDPGSTILAGQTVVELIDPQTIWLNARFDQIRVNGLRPGLAARIDLRSRPGESWAGRVERVEPKADAVTEEIHVKVVFTNLPEPLPSLGELAEVTVELPATPPVPAIASAAIHRRGEQGGVWQIGAGRARFVPIRLGPSDLDGWIQVEEGLREGEETILYSEKPLSEGRRVQVVERVAGGRR
jgi:RND family efflux transporter MFP subunit